MAYDGGILLSGPAVPGRLMDGIMRCSTQTLCFVLILLVGMAELAPAQFIGSNDVGAGGFSGPTDGAYLNARFQRMQIEQVAVETRRKEDEKRRQEQQQLLASGTVSALDLQAPPKAARDYNDGVERLKKGDATGAIERLKKAIATYPNFVSAHDGLGVAYMDSGQSDDARHEFETAISLDDKFAVSYVNMARLAMARRDAPAAEDALNHALALTPQNVETLTALAWAQQANGEYKRALETADRVHSVAHPGLANVHFIAGAAAVSLKDYDRAEREYNTLVAEDPTGPLSPSAKSNLQALALYKEAKLHPEKAPAATEAVLRTFPNSDRLRAALRSLESDAGTCADCDAAGDGGGSVAPASTMTGSAATGWTLRSTVDEVAVLFSVTEGNTLVNDLAVGDFQVRDARIPPARIVAFESQAKLPLRLGLMIDTSGSVQKRFAFEKNAASRFLATMLTAPNDVGFAAGFSTEVQVTQDFTSDVKLLDAGLASLENHGQTALFDAISFACWKLASYPDKDRVARVLVVLSDGEDNTSRNTLKQAIEAAENMGVAVYIISTKEPDATSKYGEVRPITDADHILQAIAERTGGESMFPGDFKNLNKTFDRLREVIRSRYLVAYRPANLVPNGKFRPITIVAKKEGHSFRVHARKGYYAPQN